MKWKIYYGDGTTYDGEPELAPERDVQAIVQEHPMTGWHVQSRGDYYIFRDNLWLSVDTFGFYDYMASPGWKRVLFGRTISNEEYTEIFQKALKDADFQRKSGFLPGEKVVNV